MKFKSETGNPFWVAVVDDNLSILDSTKMIFEEEGWRVSTYQTGEHFLLDLYDKNFGCLLLEPDLPGIDGVEIMRRMAVAGCDARVVVLTSRLNSNTSKLLNQYGVNAVLVKPVSETILLETVTTALQEYCNLSR